MCVGEVALGDKHLKERLIQHDRKLLVDEHRHVHTRQQQKEEG